jgi:hypothetical protein
MMTTQETLTIPPKRKTGVTNADVLKLAREQLAKEVLPQLLSALKQADQAGTTALDYAVEAGGRIAEVKQWLADNRLHLQSFPQWFKANCRDHNLRTAGDYYRCYIQVNADSGVHYPSMQAALRAYRKAHGKKRFSPETKEQQEARERKEARDEVLAGAPPGPDVEVEKPGLGSMKEWLGGATVVLNSYLSEKVRECLKNEGNPIPEGSVVLVLGKEKKSEADDSK